jgi:hypothetical protein
MAAMKSSGLLEKDLRDFISQNLEQIETGLTLVRKEAYLPAKLGTRGFIDILAVDSSRRYVLIEVKRTAGASREAIHEVLKYIEGAKAHLALRENELRAMVVAADWTELRVPFLSLVARTSCRVEGYELELTEAENIRRILPVGNTLLNTDRVLAPWHHVAFYCDSVNFEQAARAFSAACKSSGIESYILVLLAPLAGIESLPSSHEQEWDRIFDQLDEQRRDNAKPSLRQYRSMIYFAMQQLSVRECLDRLQSMGKSKDDLDLWSSSEEELLEASHEALQNFDLVLCPPDNEETGYPAKFKALTEHENWRVIDISRFGAFSRNLQISNEQLVSEICDAQADSRQSLTFTFNPSEKSALAEARKRVDICLKDNQPWRLQINYVLDMIAASGESGPSKINIGNTSAAVATIYMQSANGSLGGRLFIPFYFITPGPNSKTSYYGVLVWDGTTPKLKALINEFYQGEPLMLRIVKRHGGYEPRDVQIVRKMGLHYRTFMAVRGVLTTKHYQLADGLWEPCEGIAFVDEYYRFLWSCDEFVDDVRNLYDEWEKWNLVM